MSKLEHEALLSAQNLVTGIQVVYMSRNCVIVGFEDGKVLLESVAKDEHGRPYSSWKVEKMNLIGRPIITIPNI